MAIQAHSKIEEQVAVKKYLASLTKYKVNPLWAVMQAAVPPQPNPKAAPYVWQYEKLRPKLLEAGRLISSEQAERRVLMLTNPALSGVHTSDTLYAGLQLINPGETAPAHRHLAFALRFIVEGIRGFTAIGGEKLSMERGDVILTPSWSWHDHGHEGQGPMIWLDGLDLPLFQALPVNFAEGYAEARYPSHVVNESPLKYPWKAVQSKLDGAQTTYSTYKYPFNDHSTLARTIGAEAERLSPGSSSPPRRESASFVFHVYQGEGFTELGTGEKLEWKACDTFVVPAWVHFTHHSHESVTAYLFSFNDRPMLEALGLYRCT